MAVPYFDLTRQYATLKDELETALLSVARSGRYILGETVERFEKKFADYCGVPYGVGVGTGTDALIFSLRALGIGKGDEVIVPSYTFCASVYAILHAGATPVFADVDETYTLDPASVEKALTKKTKALLPVHLYGQCADMGALMTIAKKRKLKVVEDACQAHGAIWKKNKAGSFGDAGCFSFYPTKNLGGMGDGGMVVTKDKKVLEAVRRHRNLGRITISENPAAPGWTSRLDALQAAVLEVKLESLDALNEARRKVAQDYQQYLSATPLILPKESAGRRHVYHLFAVRVPGGKRDALKEHLAAKDIPALTHYAVPVHKQSFCRKYARPRVALRNTEKFATEVLCLPMFPEMKRFEVKMVAETVRGFYGKNHLH